MGCKTLLRPFDRINRDPFSIFVHIREVDQVCLWVVDPDIHVGIMEDLTDLVPDGIINPLNIQLIGEGGLHTVDDRQFGIPLFSDLEQALGLVEEARVLKCHAHTGGDRAQQADIGFVEGIFPLVIFHDDRANCPVTAHNIHIHT